jgi:hypothetical protein
VLLLAQGVWQVLTNSSHVGYCCGMQPTPTRWHGVLQRGTTLQSQRMYGGDLLPVTVVSLAGMAACNSAACCGVGERDGGALMELHPGRDLQGGGAVGFIMRVWGAAGWECPRGRLAGICIGVGQWRVPNL